MYYQCALLLDERSESLPCLAQLSNTLVYKSISSHFNTLINSLYTDMHQQTYMMNNLNLNTSLTLSQLVTLPKVRCTIFVQNTHCFSDS